MEPTIGDSPLRGGLVTFFANVKLGRKWLTATKGLAYNTAVLITTLKTLWGRSLVSYLYTFSLPLMKGRNNLECHFMADFRERPESKREEHVRPLALSIMKRTNTLAYFAPPSVTKKKVL